MAIQVWQFSLGPLLRYNFTEQGRLQDVLQISGTAVNGKDAAICLQVIYKIACMTQPSSIRQQIMCLDAAALQAQHALPAL